MRVAWAIGAILAALPMSARAEGVRLESAPDQVCTKKLASDCQSLANASAAAVRAHGWRCDSVSSLRSWMFSTGFTLICNNFRYSYDFEDKGGNWTVKIQ